MREDVVLCAANAYHQKYYLNPEYGNLPEDVQKELKLIAVDYVEEIGGVFLMSFNAEQKLVLKSMHEEDDLHFDDAKAQKKIGELATRYEALFTKLETYYQALETLHGRGRSSEELTEADMQAEPGANNPEGHAEVRRATSEEVMTSAAETSNQDVVAESEQGGIRMTGSWDMPVMPDDPNAEQTAYHTLFGDD